MTGPDGATRTYACTEFPVRGVDGTVAGVGGIAVEVTERDRAELVSRALLAARPQATVIVDGAGRVRLCNEAVAGLLGYDLGELVGLSIARLVPELNGSGRLGTLATVARSEESLTLAARHRDGHDLAVEITVDACAEQAEPLLIISLRDIEAGRSAARTVEIADGPLRSAFAASPVGMALIDLDASRLLQVNRALCEIVGFREEDLLAVGLDEITHTEDLSIGADTLARLRTGEVAATEVQKRYYHRRGHPIWVSVSTSLARDAAGEPHHLIGVFQNISAIKATEAALRAGNNQLQAIFDHAPAWLTLRALDGRFLNANDHLIRSLGTTRRELIGSHPGSHLDPEVAAAIHAGDHQVWETRQPVTAELEVPDRDGESHTYQVVRYPVLDDTGEVSAFGSFALDVTDRTRSAEARERALAAFEEAQRIARVGSWSWDPDAGTTAWSRQMYRIFGLAREAGELSERTLFELAAPADRTRMMKAWRTRFGGQDRFELDYAIAGEDGVSAASTSSGARTTTATSAAPVRTSPSCARRSVSCASPRSGSATRSSMHPWGWRCSTSTSASSRSTTRSARCSATGPRSCWRRRRPRSRIRRIESSEPTPRSSSCAARSTSSIARSGCCGPSAIRCGSDSTSACCVTATASRCSSSSSSSTSPSAGAWRRSCAISPTTTR